MIGSGSSIRASRRALMALTTFGQAVFWVSTAPTMTSNGVSAGHHPCGPYAAWSRRYKANRRLSPVPIGTGPPLGAISLIAPAPVSGSGPGSSGPIPSCGLGSGGASFGCGVELGAPSPFTGRLGVKPRRGHQFGKFLLFEIPELSGMPPAQQTARTITSPDQAADGKSLGFPKPPHLAIAAFLEDH